MMLNQSKRLVLFLVFVSVCLINSVKPAAFTTLDTKSNNTDYPNHCYDDHFLKQYFPVGVQQLKTHCARITCTEDYTFSYFR